MILAFDTHYSNSEATTACICFSDWSDNITKKEFTEKTNKISAYEPGKFYKRELPGIISLLQKHKLLPEIIIVDGYVWLDEKKIGLGGHLYKEIGETVSVIGVAKTRFNSHSKVKEIFRGNSQNPLFISSMGIDLHEAAENIEKMHGSFRLPTLLKRVDQLSRGIVTI